MFPSWSAKQAASKLDKLASTLPFRLAVASALTLLHLIAFDSAARQRLDLPFNAQPTHRPYYSDPDASSVRGYPRQPHYWSRLIVSRWEAQHTIGFAIRGLTSCPDDGAGATDMQYLECGLGWLPAYGVLGGAISEVSGAPEDITLMLMSVLCALFLNTLWTANLIVSRIGRREAYATLVAFNAFPTAFFLVTPYAESATLVLVVLGFVALASKRWLIAGLLVGAATALCAMSAGFAIGLGGAAIVAAYRGHKSSQRRWWRPLLAIPLCGWGPALQLIVFRIAVGDASAYFRARAALGDQLHFERLVNPSYFIQGFSAQHMDSVILLGAIAMLVLSAREVIRRFEIEEAVYLAVAGASTLLIAIVAVPGYWGLNRYLLLCPFLFFGLGTLSRKHVFVYVMWIALCAAFYWHVELCSYISHGDSRICPCLGRLEFWFPFRS